MLHGMDNLADNKGLSRVEVVCVVGIACFAVALLAVLGWYLLSLMWQGNDANALNTAQGVGNASAASVCLVPGCPGEDDPAHASHVAADGSNVAYYQKGTNTRVAQPPAGYKEGDSLVIDGKGVCALRKNVLALSTLSFVFMGLFAAGGNGGVSHMSSKNSLNDMPKPFTILSSVSNPKFRFPCSMSAR